MKLNPFSPSSAGYGRCAVSPPNIRLGKSPFLQNPEVAFLQGDNHLLPNPDRTAIERQNNYLTGAMAAIPRDRPTRLVFLGDHQGLTESWPDPLIPPVQLKRKDQVTISAKLVEAITDANRPYYQRILNWMRQDPEKRQTVWVPGNHDPAHWITAPDSQDAFYKALDLNTPEEKRRFVIWPGKQMFIPNLKLLGLHGDSLDPSCRGRNNPGETSVITMLQKLDDSVIQRLRKQGRDLSEADVAALRPFRELYDVQPVKDWGPFVNSQLEKLLHNNQGHLAQALYDELADRAERLQSVSSLIPANKAKGKKQARLDRTLTQGTKHSMNKAVQRLLKFLGKRYEEASRNPQVAEEAVWGRKTQKALLGVLGTQMQAKVTEQQDIDGQVERMETFAKKQGRMGDLDIQYMVGGHTHTPFTRLQKGRHYLNAGGNNKIMRFNQQTGTMQTEYPYGYIRIEKNPVTGHLHHERVEGSVQ